MKSFILPKQAARLVVLQRIELASPFLRKIRKLFGRFIFSNFITKYFLNSKVIEKNYHNIMLSEFLSLKRFIKPNDKLVLSIGGGIGGLELIINQNQKDKNFFFY